MKNSGFVQNHRNIRSGDLVFTTLHELSNYLVLLFTGSISNHIAIALWISQEGVKNKTLDILPSYRDGAKLHLLEMSRAKTHDLRYAEKINNQVIVDFEDAKKRLDRAYFRPLRRDISDEELVSKLKKFVEEEKNVKFSIGAMQGVNMIFNVGKIDHSSVYHGETCVSFVLKWLCMNGYKFDDPNVPKRSRQLYVPDHLMETYNTSDVFESTEEQFYFKPNRQKSWTFIFVVFVLTFLIISVICNLILVRYTSKQRHIINSMA